MAGLAGKDISNTYKDVLNLYNTVENEGITTSIKRIFDGGGVGSPIWISTNLMQVGSDGPSNAAHIEVYGTVTAEKYKLKTSIGNVNHEVLSINEDGSVNFQAPIITKSTVTFKAAGHDDMVMDATNGAMQRGDGSKGKVTLGSTAVTLQKGSTNLMTAKDDGTIQFQNITSGNEPSEPQAGDLIVIDGNLNIGV